MKPPKREFNYEKVKVGDFVTGKIASIEYDMEHEFVYQGQKKETPAVRFIFDLDGYKFKHYSRWLSFNYGEKANLYNKYLVKLVDNVKPDCDFDLDRLRGMAVKTIWAEKNDFQNIENIFPLNEKLVFTSEPAAEHEEITDIEPEEEQETQAV